MVEGSWEDNTKRMKEGVAGVQAKMQAAVRSPHFPCSRMHPCDGRSSLVHSIQLSAAISILAGSDALAPCSGGQGSGAKAAA